jgi:P-type Mg2+ transporter
MKKAEPAAQEKKILDRLYKYSQIDPLKLMSEWGITTEGLSEKEVERRKQTNGLNIVDTKKSTTWYYQLFNCIVNPFNILLFVLAFISRIISDIESMILMITMACISIVVRFFQEYRSEREAEKLKAMVQTTALVKRCPVHGQASTLIEIPIEQIVPGDIVKLAAGDMVPADLKLISARDLFVNQSMLTGEALPVEKSDQAIGKAATALQQPNLCFMGSNVVSGTAQGLVVGTGKQTYLGVLARALDTPPPPGNFELGINRITWLLIRFVLIMTVIVFFINWSNKGDILSALMFAMAVGVGLTPEMLPMIVTANLAKGAIGMAKRKVIVKHLNGIHHFGSMDVLCTDKTGTLTLDKVVLQHHLNRYGKEDIAVLKFGYLNSVHQTSLKNLLDAAILDEAECKHRKTNFFNEVEQYTKIDELPFDFVRRRMSVVVSDKHKMHWLICKGAVEEILSVSRYVEEGGDIVPMTTAAAQEIVKRSEDLNASGFRILLLAYRKIKDEQKTYSKEDERELVVKGILAFLDPPKESAYHAIPALLKHGVKIKVITGDNPIVTSAVCKQVGLPAEPLLLGQEIEALSFESLCAKVEETVVFSKVSPVQKSLIIKALKSNGHVVGFLGDGVNDALALREADVGITVDTATDIAKESSDIIMLEKSLMVLEQGILAGRMTFMNIIKYIKMALSSNFGNVFTIVGASLILPFLPILPGQLLVQNLLSDISQTTIPLDRVDPETVEKPCDWSNKDLIRFMLFFGPISSIFDYLTFALLWFYFGENSVAHQSLFHTGWFVEGLVTQILIVHVIRTRRLPFIESTAAPALLFTTGLVVAIGVWLPFSPFAEYMKLVSLPGIYFVWVSFIIIGYLILSNLVKVWYIRRFKAWL